MLLRQCRECECEKRVRKIRALLSMRVQECACGRRDTKNSSVIFETVPRVWVGEEGYDQFPLLRLFRVEWILCIFRVKVSHFGAQNPVFGLHAHEWKCTTITRFGWKQLTQQAFVCARGKWRVWCAWCICASGARRSISEMKLERN